jgi:hypothetical protein
LAGLCVSGTVSCLLPLLLLLLLLLLLTLLLLLLCQWISRLMSHEKGEEITAVVDNCRS